ncbi:MAG: hypothetical protein R3Y58_12655 [Eubacteriales bacterium]
MIEYLNICYYKENKINEGEGIENYYLEFPEPKTLETALFNDDIRVELDRTKTIVEDSKFFEFQDELFERTIIIRNIDFENLEENPTIQFMPAGERKVFKMKVDFPVD